MKYVYPAIFKWSESDKAYIVQFVDSDNWYTDGESLTLAMENAIDVLNLMLLDAEDSGDTIPPASTIEDIAVEPNAFAQYIFADTDMYKQIIETRKSSQSA